MVQLDIYNTISIDIRGIRRELMVCMMVMVHHPMMEVMMNYDLCYSFSEGYNVFADSLVLRTTSLDKLKFLAFQAFLHSNVTLICYDRPQILSIGHLKSAAVFE